MQFLTSMLKARLNSVGLTPISIMSPWVPQSEHSASTQQANRNCYFFGLLTLQVHSFYKSERLVSLAWFVKSLHSSTGETVP